MIKALIKMIKGISVGIYTLSPEPFMGPMITERHAKKLLEIQNELRLKGEESLVEMKHLKPGTGFLSPGLMDVTAIKDRPDEEIFGPFLQLIRIHDLQEAIEEANRTKFGLPQVY